MVSKGMKLLDKVSMAGWIAIILGMFLAFQLVLMFQSFWDALDWNNQVGILIITITLIAISSSRGILKKGR
jgi:hypothetical protein